MSDITIRVESLGKQYRIGKRERYRTLVDGVNAALERRFWLWATLFIALFLACSIIKDVRAKMWTDELLTLHMSQQGSSGEIVKATLEGCDGAPPLYAMLVRAIRPWVRHGALATRLPATIGYCGMVLCLLAFCRRRLPAAYSAVAALLACNACLGYSTEGRCYGVVLCCAAGALLCWQSAVDGTRRILAIPLLALCLALMTAMHYYSIFFLVPLFLAEMVRWRRSGRLDFVVLAAMAPVLFVLGLHYPLIAASRQFQERYWSPAALGGIPAMYSSYLCLLPLGLLAAFSTTPDGRGRRKAGLTLPEWVAAGAFSLMPLCVVVLSKYTTHVFVARYTLWAATGVAALVAAALCLAARGKKTVGVSMLAILVTLITLREVNGLCKRPALIEGEAVRQELASLSDGSEPILVADSHLFMELSYYAAPRLRERLTYPVSRSLDLRYLGFDTSSLLLSALSSRTKLNVVSYAAVLSAHRRFVLAALPADYLPWHLITAGYRVVPIGSSHPPVLYEVEAPGRGIGNHL